jgi:glucose-1-phosphate cytidylyltransferase
MKVVILAGGFGSRMSEETQVRPKPLVEIGGKPILWHIMKIYASHGMSDFIICCGYKGFMIKQYFANYFVNEADCRFDLKNNRMEVLRNGVEPWTVTLVDTGESTMTGGRLRRVRDYLGADTFCLTYGDGVSNENIPEVVAFHRKEQALATLTATQPPGRFGALTLGAKQTHVDTFREKPGDEGAWINGGFFVLEPAVIDYIEGDSTSFEREPLEKLAQNGKLAAFKHRGFWQPMDSLRDKVYLEDLWSSGKAPWKIW